MDDLSIRPEIGLSFELPHLIIARAWADYHGLSFTIELDRLICGTMCDEVLCFSLPRFRYWTLWRSGDRVVAQPDSGPALSFPSLPEALEGLGLEEMILSA